MKKAKKSSVKKSIRFPMDVDSEIKEAAKKDFKNNYSDAVVYRAKHFEAPLTPIVVSKVQNIVNAAISKMGTPESEEAKEMQKEIDGLWNYLK